MQSKTQNDVREKIKKQYLKLKTKLKTNPVILHMQPGPRQSQSYSIST